jgi:hypothetical protein
MAKRRQQRSTAASGSTARTPSRRSGAAPPPTRRPRPAAQRRGLLGGADPVRVGIIAAVTLVAGVLLVAVLLSGGDGGRYTCGQQLAPAGSPEVGQVTANMGRTHVARGTAISYLFCPPSSGTHYNNETGFSPARPGFYRPDAAIGPGSWIHNLEHGYVVALYRCPDGVCPPEDVLDEIRRFVNNAPQTQVAANCGIRAKVVAARFDDMSTPFALVTWDRVSLLQSWDVDVAIHFANAWMEKTGPEAGSC